MSPWDPEIGFICECPNSGLIQTQVLKFVYQLLYTEQFPNLSVLIFLRDLPLTSIKADSEVKISPSPAFRPNSDKNRNPGGRIQGLQALLKPAAPAAVWCHSAWQIPRARCRAVPWDCFCSLSLTGGPHLFPLAYF